MKMYVTGVSGTGKTTVAKELAKRGISVISIDESPGLCIWVNKISGEGVKHDVELNRDFVKNHSWICNVTHLKELVIQKKGPIVVLGMASNQDDFLDMFDKILLLQCSPNTFISRINNRTNNDFGKDKTIQESLLVWHKAYEKKILDRVAISINTEQSVEKVADEIVEHIGS